MIDCLAIGGYNNQCFGGGLLNLESKTFRIRTTFKGPFVFVSMVGTEPEFHDDDNDRLRGDYIKLLI